MILHKKFAVSHIGKTGGDAVKQIIDSIHLPGVFCSRTDDRRKHIPVKNVTSSRQIWITIRRLPARELSFYFHCKQHIPELIDDPSMPIGEFIVSQAGADTPFGKAMGEPLIIKHADNESVKYIRQERLRDDVLHLLLNYFRLTEKQRKMINTAPTKKPMSYPHNVHDFFTDEQIADLYWKSPVWESHEIVAYGNPLKI